MIQKHKTEITKIVESEWLPVLRNNRRILSPEHVFCRLTKKNPKSKNGGYFIKLSIGCAITDVLDYKDRQNVVITINRNRPHLYLVKKKLNQAGT
jgi:hypothetical protein